MIMKCNYCKKTVEHDMSFCPYCGKPIDHSTPLDKYLNDDIAVSPKPVDKLDRVFNSHEQTINETKPQIQKPSDANLKEPVKPSKNYEDFYMPKIFNPDNVDEMDEDVRSKDIENKKHNIAAGVPDNIKPQKFDDDNNAAGAERIKRKPYDPDEYNYSAEVYNRKKINREPLYKVSDTNEYEINKDIPHSYGVRSTSTNSRKKIIIISAIALVLILGVLGYFLLSGSKPELKQKVTSIEAGTEIDMLSLVELENDNKFDVSVKSGEIDNMNVGEYNVIYKVTNKKTNKSEEFEFMFQVVDTTPPQITAPESINVIKNSQFDILENVTAYDTVDGNIDKSKITISGSIDAAVKGTYPVTLSVSDKAGNSGTATINVIVDDPVTFYNSIKGVWKFQGNESQLLIIKKEGNEYLMFIGFEQSEGFGGEFSFKNVSSDNKTATLVWTFVDEEGTQTQEVLIDTGTPGDKKMKMDFGEGWENLIYFKKNE